jgi:hypothetical protein
MQLLSHQCVEIHVDQSRCLPPEKKPVILSRAQRAHYRLSWQERLTRNARPPGASLVRIKQIARPSDAFATSLGLLTT